ncbi:MAG: serine hydrolase domain-containing protein [Pseudomonadales bacterium]
MRIFAFVAIFALLPSTQVHAQVASAMDGIPPSPDSQVTLANYRNQPFNHWSFRNTGAFFNTLSIGRAGKIQRYKVHEKASVASLQWREQQDQSLERLLAENDTDGFLVLKNNKILFERYFGDMKASDKHIWFSMTKSLVSSAAGILVEQGLLDLDKSPADYIPELKNSGFARVTVQQVLDHSSALDFKENYTDLTSEFARFYAPALNMGYMPGARDLAPGKGVIYGVHDFVSDYVKSDTSLKPGDAFDYNSANADVLGWLVARLSGLPLHKYLEQNIWSKLHTEHDAFIAADRAYMAVATGGMNSTLRDAARFGQMILQRGKYKGTQIIPADWVDASLNLSEANKSNMRDNPKYANMPWQAYHNMWWILDADKGEYAAVGIHGQVIYINRKANTVIAWFSSQQKASAANNPQFNAKLEVSREIAEAL